MTAYCGKMNEMRKALVAVGETITGVKHVHHMLRNVPLSYKAFATLIRQFPLTSAEAQQKLEDEQLE